MASNELTEEQQNILTSFQEFTGLDSVETSCQYLSAHDWDIQRALNTFLVCGTEPQTPIRTTTESRATDLVSPLRPSSPVLPLTIVRYLPYPIVRFFRIPLSFLYTFYVKARPFLPWNLARVAFTFFRSFIWRKPIPTPLEEIDHYCNYFNQKYGTEHSPFYRGQLSQALRDAQREVRLLLVYLHDKKSPVCDRFVREVLCGNTLQSIIGNHLFWSASRETQEGISASHLLHANGYPCLCIIAHHGSQQTVPLKLEHYTGRDQCLAEIINGFEQANQILENNRERRNQSDSRDRLLQEQNAAYLESMRADQEKAEQRLREENERRLAEEEQQRKLQAFADFRENLRENIAPEPAASEENTIQVSIRLPADEPIRRRFSRHDPAKLLFEFAWTQNNVPDQFELLWGYPRKRYRYDQMENQTIAELIGGNTETCYLEEIYDER